MKRNDATHLGIEIGPRLVRAVLLDRNNAVRMAQRIVEGPPEGAWPALNQVLKEIKAPPRTAVSVALLPPYVDTQTLKGVPQQRGRTPSALRLRLQQILQRPLDDYAIAFVEQGGLHNGDLYVAFAAKGHLREIYRATRAHRLRVQRIEPWYQALPRPWVAREPELKNGATLFVGIHQDRLSYVGRARDEVVELIAHDALPGSIHEYVTGIESVYYELSQNLGEEQVLAVVLSSDNKDVYDDVTAPLRDAGFSVVVPEGDEQMALGDFCIAAGTALSEPYAGLNSNLWSPSLEEEFEGNRIPPVAAAPLAVALLVMGLGFLQVEGAKADLARALADVDAQIAQVKPDADRAAQLKAQLDRKLSQARTLEDALFGKGRWSKRLDELFALLGQHGVAVSQVSLSTPPRGEPTATFVITSPRASSVFKALEALERRYPKITPAPVSAQKVAARPVYSTTVTVEVAR